MNTNAKDLSYFTVRLKELLRASFPELLTDGKFISQRSKLAAEAYEQAFKAGNISSQCNEIAEFILFENLHFSRFDLVFKVVCNEFDRIMADEELRPFSMKMLEISNEVFSAYTITDDFSTSIEYDLLYTELAGTIAIWIEENGLQ